MYEVFKRELKPFDMVLVEGVTMRTTTISRSNFNLVIAKDKVFTGNALRTATDCPVYLIENPTMAEMELKNSLLHEWDRFVQNEAVRKRETSKRISELKKEIANKNLQLGTVLSEADTIYGNKALFLGKCLVEDRVRKKSTEGYCYYAFSASQSDLAEMFSYKDTPISLEILLQKYISSSDIRYQREKLREQNVSNNIHVYEGNVKHIMTFKSLSTKYSSVVGSVNIALPASGEYTIYAREYGRWNTIYDYVTFKFLQ